jgi:hypothetical protein
MMMTLLLQKLKSIWSWITNPRNQSAVLFLAGVVLAILFLRGCNQQERLEAELRMKENNLIAMKDTVRIEKTKSGELQYVKTAFMADMNDLKELNRDLYDKVKDQESQVFYISQIAAQIQDKVNGFTAGGDHDYDPVSGNDNITWTFDTTGTNWSRKIVGSTQFKVTSTCSGYTIEPRGSNLSEVNYKFGLTTGLKESEKYPGSLEIFINSSYPGMTFSDIQGSIVNPEDFKKFLPSTKVKKWSLGPYVGLGYGLTLNKTPQLVPTFNFGLGLQYKVISF